MKILVLVPDLQHKGGVTNYYNCLKLDQEPNIDYFFVNTVVSSREANPGLPKTVSYIRKAVYLPFIYLKFMARALDYQLIHINPSLNFKSFFRDMVFIFLSKAMGKKVLVFLRGWDEEFEEYIRNRKSLLWLFRLSYARANGYIVLGEVFQEKLINLQVDPDKKFYIETTVSDTDGIGNMALEKKINSFDEEVNLLFISRILRNKGIYIALDSCAKCIEKYPDRKITLYVAGDGEELDNAMSYVAAKGYKRIRFVGYVTNEAKKNLLLKSHVMIFPTYYGEGLPNCILEGMAYGMPIISREVGGIPDVVEHNHNGFLSMSLTSDIYADYCIRLIENKDLYEKIARGNCHKASSLYATPAVRKRLLGIYRKNA